MGANLFKIEGRRVDSLDEFFRLERDDKWSEILFYPDKFGSIEREPLVIEKKIFDKVSFKNTDIFNVKFIRCAFNECLFVGASIEDCEFIDCKFINTNTNKVRISQTLLDPLDFENNFDLVVDTNIAVDLFQAIYKNSVEQHQPEYALESLYHMKDAEKHHFKSQLDRSVITKKEYLKSKYAYEVYDFISGYGLRFKNVIRFALIVIILFTIANYLFRDYVFGSDTILNLFDIFYFTCVTVTTLGYGDIVPITSGGKIWVIIQTFFGFTVISLFLAAVANKAFRGR